MYHSGCKDAAYKSSNVGLRHRHQAKYGKHVRKETITLIASELLSKQRHASTIDMKQGCHDSCYDVRKRQVVW
jgi:hypothetical protein